MLIILTKRTCLQTNNLCDFLRLILFETSDNELEKNYLNL